jgi:hypothetical protein
VLSVEYLFPKLFITCSLTLLYLPASLSTHKN